MIVHSGSGKELSTRGVYAECLGFVEREESKRTKLHNVEWESLRLVLALVTKMGLQCAKKDTSSV